MSSLYLSTGRKPTQLTRKFARLLSLILNAKYENRGKKSVDEICARAEKFGRTRAAFIYEKKGNPSAIEFYDEESGWLPAIIAIDGISLPERKARKRIPENLRIEEEDEVGKKLTDLLRFGEGVEDETSLLRGKFSKKAMAFFLADEKILEIKCRLLESAGKMEGK